MKRLKHSRVVSLIAAFAAVNVICDSLIGPPLPFSGVWYSWIFISEPITGIILGPWTSFLSTFIGVIAGHFIYFRGAEEFLFTIGAPIGAMTSGLLYRGKWKIVLAYYMALLGAYFATPIAWQLPLWGMWDTYLALGLLFAVIIAMEKWKNLWNVKSNVNLVYILALSTFIGLEADVLFRIFVFIPCQTYQLFYNIDAGTLQAIWALGAVETPIKALLSAIVTVIIGLPIINVVRKMNLACSEN